MNFVIDRDKCLGPLQLLAAIAERKRSNAGSGQILLATENNALSLVASDLELELSVDLEQEIATPGRIAISGRKLLDIVRALPAGAQIDIRDVRGYAVVRSGRSRFSLASVSAEEFPRLGDFDSLADLDLPARQLKGVLDEVQVAMAQQDVRYYLNGMLLELAPNRLRAVATDGHRLALRDLPLAHAVREPLQFIIPRKTVTELQRVLELADADIHLELGNKQCKFEMYGKILISKLIDGRYPDYDRVIPKGCDKLVIAEREPLRQGLARSAVLCSERFKVVRVFLERDKLRAIAINADREEAEEEVDIRYAGPPLEIAFNVSYLMDALSVIKTDQVRLEIKDASSSCLVKPEGREDYLEVIMPMRT
ncbi:MAG: DNA polymerase III subunit beta [Gammaproteobacteria bacterium]